MENIRRSGRVNFGIVRLVGIKLKTPLVFLYAEWGNLNFWNWWFICNSWLV